jgi:hypothetical protein
MDRPAMAIAAKTRFINLSPRTLLEDDLDNNMVTGRKLNKNRCEGTLTLT